MVVLRVDAVVGEARHRIRSSGSIASLKRQAAHIADHARALAQTAAFNESEVAAVTEVTHEKELKELKLHEQGDKSMSTPEAFKLRQRLRRHHLVMAQLNNWWGAAKITVQLVRPSALDLTYDDYEWIYRAISKEILDEEDFDEVEAKAEALEEWQKDSDLHEDGSRTMPRATFMDSMFQIADLYALTLDANDYANFLGELLGEVVDPKTGGIGTRIGLSRVSEPHAPKARKKASKGQGLVPGEQKRAPPENVVQAVKAEPVEAPLEEPEERPGVEPKLPKAKSSVRSSKTPPQAPKKSASQPNIRQSSSAEPRSRRKSSEPPTEYTRPQRTPPERGAERPRTESTAWRAGGTDAGWETAASHYEDDRPRGERGTEYPGVRAGGTNAGWAQPAYDSGPYEDDTPPRRSQSPTERDPWRAAGAGDGHTFSRRMADSGGSQRAPAAAGTRKEEDQRVPGRRMGAIDWFPPASGAERISSPFSDHMEWGSSDNGDRPWSPPSPERSLLHTPLAAMVKPQRSLKQRLKASQIQSAIRLSRAMREQPASTATVAVAPEGQRRWKSPLQSDRPITPGSPSLDARPPREQGKLEETLRLRTPSTTIVSQQNIRNWNGLFGVPGARVRVDERYKLMSAGCSIRGSPSTPNLTAASVNTVALQLMQASRPTPSSLAPIFAAQAEGANPGGTWSLSQLTADLALSRQRQSRTTQSSAQRAGILRQARRTPKAPTKPLAPIVAKVADGGRVQLKEAP